MLQIRRGRSSINDVSSASNSNPSNDNMTNSRVIHASSRLGFGLVEPRADGSLTLWLGEDSRGEARGDAEEVEGGGRLIRHGARAQSPPLDIMCLPAARTRTHHLPRVCTWHACARASVTSAGHRNVSAL